MTFHKHLQHNLKTRFISNTHISTTTAVSISLCVEQQIRIGRCVVVQQLLENRVRRARFAQPTSDLQDVLFPRHRCHLLVVAFHPDETVAAAGVVLCVLQRHLDESVIVTGLQIALVDDDGGQIVDAGGGVVQHWWYLFGAAGGVIAAGL